MASDVFGRLAMVPCLWDDQRPSVVVPMWEDGARGPGFSWSPVDALLTPWKRTARPRMTLAPGIPAAPS